MVFFIQKCTCLAFAPGELPASDDTKEKNKVNLPFVVAGYGDGTVRMFDINKEEMVLKMHPHAVSVTAISFSSDGKSCLYHLMINLEDICPFKCHKMIRH